ncbi:MAG TPA: polyphosphate kinase 2 family protein [Xanthobacteraceae bacterium]|nr:polyphosphate kinase 2 family protein [Xanthobacteraceae bacterium]
MKAQQLIAHLRVDHPKRFRLADTDPADSFGLDIEKDEAQTMLAEGTKRLAELQERLYAQDRWALLVILQGVDTAGKDGVIEHVMSGVNPQGCQIHSFKAPSEEELDHDFLWRNITRLPERGRIGIFNRSYYEEVLVVRVHPEILAGQKLPPALVGKKIWQHRFKDIRAFERYLTRNGIVILKFHLRISKEEQRRRLLARLDEPAKRWKFSMRDVAERKLWDKYMDCYEDMIRHTSTPEAPWHVVPTDHKWFAHLAIAATIVERLERLNLQFPKVEGAALAEMRKVRKALMAERPGRGGR